MPGLRDSNAFGRVSKALRSYDNSLIEVGNTRKQVDDILGFKDFNGRAGGLF